MKGDLFYNTKGKLQCRHCYELRQKNIELGKCPFCTRLRWMDAFWGNRKPLLKEKSALPSYRPCPYDTKPQHDHQGYPPAEQH